MGREEEREGEKQQLAAFRVEPATQACALTGNQTSNLLLCQTMANQPSHTGQDYIEYFLRLEWNI